MPYGIVKPRLSIFFVSLVSMLECLIRKVRPMLVKYKIPKTILWVANLFVIFLLIFTLFRLATFIAFRPKGISLIDVIPSFLMGIRYDLRWIAIILLPVIFLSTFPWLSPFYSSRNKKQNDILVMSLSLRTKFHLISKIYDE